MNKADIKQLLGEIPFSAELFWYLRQTGKPPTGGYSLKKLQRALPRWVNELERRNRRVDSGTKVLIFSMLRYWIEHTSLLGLVLSALGNQVTLAYLPYRHWKKSINRFDLRRQNIYLSRVLDELNPFVQPLSMLDVKPLPSLPGPLKDGVDRAAFRDVQYSLLREEVERDSELYLMRLKRNDVFARSLLEYIQSNRPDVLVVPNGSILEFGIAFQVARHLDIPTVSFEFGEQDERIWLAQNADVMRQDTSGMWEACENFPLTGDQWQRVKDFFAARQGGALWENFSRRWQGVASQGGKIVRELLDLDARPIVLLPTNVLGDSLTLGRQIFSDSMTSWLSNTIRYFFTRDDWQFVIRVHPGEQLGWGPSVYDLLRDIYPDLPSHIHLLPADAAVNTYDLVDAAELGLVFTTTVGMEMAMSGLPVIVAGQTHYRNKGFTLDPDSWNAYYAILDEVLESPEKYRPSRKKVERAWTYAYRFFFEYPQPYPWHVQHFWEDVQKWPLELVLSDQGMARFGDTFRYLAGEKIHWNAGRKQIQGNA
jgi:hypothetical protein